MIRKNQNLNGKASRSFRIFGNSESITELLSLVCLRTMEYCYDGQIVSSIRAFTKKPYPRGVDTMVLLITFMFLLIKHIIPRTILNKPNGMTKFVPVIEFLTGKRYRDESDVFARSICKAIVLVDNEGVQTPIDLVAKRIHHHLVTLIDDYKAHRVYALKLNVFSGERIDSAVIPTDEEVISELKKRCKLEEKVSYFFSQSDMENHAEEPICQNNSRFPSYITKLPNKNKLKMDKYLKELEADPDYKGQPPKPSVFLVGDIETIPLLDRNYVPAEIIESKIFPATTLMQPPL